MRKAELGESRLVKNKDGSHGYPEKVRSLGHSHYSWSRPSPLSMIRGSLFFAAVVFRRM